MDKSKVCVRGVARRGASAFDEATGVGCGDIPLSRAGGSERIARDGWID